MKRKLKKEVVLGIKILINLVFIILSCCLFFKVKEMNILPDKYLLILVLVLIGFNILGMLFLYIKGIVSKVISGVLYVVLLGLCILGIKYSNTTIKFLNSSFGNMKEYVPFDVIVLKDSEYTKIEDLNDKKLGYLLLNTKEYVEEIEKKINVELESHDIYSLHEGLMNRTIDGAVIGHHYLELLEEIYPGFNDLVSVIYSYNIEIEVEKNIEKVKELKPVNIYISGLDNRSNVVEATGLSDVNMILTVNPKSKILLITSIPRDFYVQLHGTTGIRDKLTHSGAYGIEMGKTTLEDLFEINIDYTIKVGFVSVVNIVDFIGGIDIESDTAFWAYTYPGWYVHEGVNHMDGAHALAYARERRAYSDGDYHRVRNQQQVFEAIFDKIVNNKDMLYKYDTLLSELSNLYITDIPKEYVTLLVKSQLNNMKSWKVIKQTVYGESFMTSCYSLPGWTVLAVEPNMDSINEARTKIEEVLNQ